MDWAAGILGIDGLLDRKPRQLSGGQRQRVALARALVREPNVFLLDEPLSNLDAQRRASARDELQQFQRRVGTTTIYVTHDQVEAMGMGDRIAVIEQGRIRQLGTPHEIYDDPADTFVATFLGSPPMNLVPDASGELLGFRPEHFVPWQPEMGDDWVALSLSRPPRGVPRRGAAALRRDRRDEGGGALPGERRHRCRDRAARPSSPCAATT